MEKIKPEAKLRKMSMKAKKFPSKMMVVDLDTAIDCVYQAMEEKKCNLNRTIKIKQKKYESKGD